MLNSGPNWWFFVPYDLAGTTVLLLRYAPFFMRNGTDMTVGDSCAGFPVDDFCKLVLSDHDFHNITLASPTTDYKRWKNEWIDEWMSMKEMEMWVNEGTNEWTSNEQNTCIYITCEWVDECPKIADGVNELVNIIQFILVTMHMITQYMCTYVCLHLTGYVEYTTQIILCLQNCP